MAKTMKKSLTEQFRDYERTIDKFIEITRARLIDELQIPLPGVPLYECIASPRCFNPDEVIKEWTIAGDFLRFEGINIYSRPRVNKVARRTDLNTIIGYWSALQKAEPDMLIRVYRLGKFGREEGAVQAKEIDGVKYAWSREAIAPTIDKIRHEYEKNYAPREGCVACERCGKQVPVAKVVKYELIYQGLDQFGVRRIIHRIGTFCSGKCAESEQMSLED